MTWNAYHRRNEALRTVMTVADRHRDGTLPWAELGDTASAFDSPEDLLLAIQMRWHNRLSGRVEAELTEQPADVEAAIARAWRETAADFPGARAILDASERHPALAAARDKELAFLASAAGLASVHDPAAPRFGLRIRAQGQSIIVDRKRPQGYQRRWSRLRQAFAA